MFITTLATVLIMTQAQAAPVQGVSCPIMGSQVQATGPYTDYNGVRYLFCCPGCDTRFQANPAQYIKAESNKGKTIGIFLFDPVTRERLDYATATGGHTDHNGVRYFFRTAANKRAFDAEKAKFATLPQREALHCPVMDSNVASYNSASGYADLNGVRYYFCCAGCHEPFTKDPAALAAKVAEHVGAPKTFSGKIGEETTKACCAEKTADERAKCCGGGLCAD